MRPVRVATLEEVLRYGSRGGHKALRARGLMPPIEGAAGLAIDASTPVYKSTTTVSTTNQVTASFTPPLGSLLVVAFAEAASATTMQKPVNTGGAVTWDAAVKVNEAANAACGAIWCGLVTTSASMTVTVTLASGTDGDWGFGVVVVTGQAATQNGITGVNTSASGLPTQTVTTVGANSLILGTVANFTNGTGPTIPAGQSDSFNAHAFLMQNGTSGATWAQYLTGINLAAGASAQINDTAPTIAYSLAMAEILADTGTARAVFPVFLPTNTLRRGVRNLRQMAAFRARVPDVVVAGPAVLATSTSDTSLTSTSCSRVLFVSCSTADTSLSSDAIIAVSRHPCAVADSSTSSDALSRSAIPYVRSTADTSLSTETLTRVETQPRSVADTSLSSDAASAGTTHPRSTADTSVSSDALSRTSAKPRSTADTSLSSDAATPAKGYARSTADTSLSSDVLTRGPLLLARSTADTSASSDSVVRVFSLTRSVADTSLSSDAVTPAKGYARSIADTSLSFDALTRGALILARSTADTSASSDALTRAVLFTRTVGGSYSSVILAGQPAAYWRLDELSGTVATDSSGNGNTAAYHTGFTLAQSGALYGDPDTAVSFTGGTNAQVDGLAASALALSTGSVEAWVKTTSSGAVKGIAVKQNAYGIYLNSAGRVDGFDYTAAVFLSSGTATGNGTNGPLINDGNWHHVALTFQSGVIGGAVLYVDGVAVAGLAHPTITVSSQATDFQIASGHFAGQNLPGTVDEVAVYNYVLSAAQIANRYSIGQYGADVSLSSDTLTTVKGVARSTADTTVSSDALTRTLALIRSTADTSLSSDVATPSTPGRFSRSTADTSLSSDALTRIIRLVRSTADSSLSSDSLTTIKGVARFTADTSLSSDAATRTLLTPRSSADSSLSSDAVTSISRFPRSVADTSLSSDTITRQTGRLRSTADTSLSSDVLTRIIRLVRSTADSSLSSDTATTSSRIPRSISDTSHSTDLVSRALTLPRSTSDTSLSSDATTRGGLHYIRSSADSSLTVDHVFTGFGLPTAVCLPTVSTLSSPYSASSSLHGYSTRTFLAAYSTAAKLARYSTAISLSGYATNATVAGYAAPDIGGGAGGICGGTVYTIGGIIIGGALGTAELAGGLPTNSTLVRYQTMSTLLPYEAAEKIPSCVA